MEVEKLRATLEEIQGQLVSTEETKGWLERRLDEAEVITFDNFLSNLMLSVWNMSRHFEYLWKQ